MNVRKDFVTQPGFTKPLNEHLDYIEFQIAECYVMLKELQAKPPTIDYEAIRRIIQQEVANGGSSSSTKKEDWSKGLLPPPSHYGIEKNNPPASNYQKSRFLLDDK